MVKSFRNWRFYLVPVILSFVSLAHMFFVGRLQLNPWQGAGFAMFAWIDGYFGRQLRIYAISESQNYPLEGKELFDFREAVSIMNLPLDSRLKHLADEASKFYWVCEKTKDKGSKGQNLKDVCMDVAGPRRLKKHPVDRELPQNLSRVDFTAIKAEVWTFGFDREAQMLRPKRIKEMTVRKVAK